MEKYFFKPLINNIMEKFDLNVHLTYCERFYHDPTDVASFNRIISDILMISDDHINSIIEMSENHFGFFWQLALFKNNDEPIFTTHECVMHDSKNKCTIECLTLPGCVTQGKNRKDSIVNLLRSMIECSIVRKRENLDYTGERKTNDINLYGTEQKSLPPAEIIDHFKRIGYVVKLDGPYHTIMMKPTIPYTFSIPKQESIYHLTNFIFLSITPIQIIGF